MHMDHMSDDIFCSQRLMENSKRMRLIVFGG